MSTATMLSPEVLAKYQPVIGLEVHVQLLTKTKAFCGCVNLYGGEPNTHVCPTCLGLPGSLPVLNRQAVEFAVLAAHAINCEIRETSIFARKNYFYPDLPKGYQISQYDRPLAEHGFIVIKSENAPKKIGITRVHLEEDAGKSLHQGFPGAAASTAIDLNRTGVPLIEIVSEPDIASPDEAYEYLTRLREIILYTAVSDCNMEEGSLRSDANVSVRRRGQKEFGTKTEIKNVNSFRFIREALGYEIDRQVGVLESGGAISQETRLYNSAEGKTYAMRSKAEARRARMVSEYGITDYDAGVLTSNKALADQFEEAAGKAKNPKRVANLVQSEVMGRVKAQDLTLEQSPISMKGVAFSADSVEAGVISGKMIKHWYDLCFERNQNFPTVYEKENPQQLTETGAIEKLIE